MLNFAVVTIEFTNMRLWRRCIAYLAGDWGASIALACMTCKVYAIPILPMLVYHTPGISLWFLSATGIPTPIRTSILPPYRASINGKREACSWSSFFFWSWLWSRYFCLLSLISSDVSLSWCWQDLVKDRQIVYKFTTRKSLLLFFDFLYSRELWGERSYIYRVAQKCKSLPKDQKLY